MQGERVEKAKQALIYFLKSLPQDSFFNIVSFGSTWSQMFEEIQRYADESIDLATNQIKTFEADMGGT